ncbi:hypothetical protein DMUE_0625 [Dictyocoela muelleri]|nr:hypothetical protein DMUE_0625 [Dictyocoela muelleri]
MQNLFWMRSNKNNPVPVINSFLFRIKSKMESGKCYWRCSKEGCSVSAITDQNELTRLNGIHNHSNDEEKILNLQLKEKMIMCVSNEPHKNLQQIYENLKHQVELAYSGTSDFSSIINSFDYYQSSLYRFDSAIVPSLQLVDSVTFDYNFFRLSVDRDLLIHVEFDPDLVIILGEIKFIEKFTTSRRFKITMDGIFKSSSNSFKEIYILHGCFSGQSFPLIYCFLNGKTERLYTKVLNIIKQKLWINPKIFHSLDSTPKFPPLSF